MVWRSTLFILAALFVAFSNAQDINPRVIAGESETNVTITCTSFLPEEAVNNALQIYNRTTDTFESFENNPRLRRASDVGSVTTYTFGPLMPNDNGMIFICISTQRNSPNATIVVTFRSVITRTPGSPQGDPVILRNGQTAEIRFNIAANPPPSPSSFRWFKDGELTNSSNGLMLSQDAFIVNPAREEHNGTYSLQVTNIAGPSYYNFTLIIQYPPRFQTDFVDPKSTNCVENDKGDVNFVCASVADGSIRLLCGVEGNPPPIVNHTFSGETPVVTDGNFVIDPVMTSSAGNYTCTSNSDRFPESISRRFRLYVGGPPTSPSRVVPSVNTIEGRVEFTWVYDNSVNGVPASNFSLTITQNGQTVFSVPLTIRQSSDMYTYEVLLSRLERGQMYTVNVVAYNLQGQSTPISQFFSTPMNSGVVSSASYLLSLLLLVVVMLL